MTFVESIWQIFLAVLLTIIDECMQQATGPWVAPTFQLSSKTLPNLLATAHLNKYMCLPKSTPTCNYLYSPLFPVAIGPPNFSTPQFPTHINLPCLMTTMSWTSYLWRFSPINLVNPLFKIYNFLLFLPFPNYHVGEYAFLATRIALYPFKPFNTAISLSNKGNILRFSIISGPILLHKD